MKVPGSYTVEAAIIVPIVLGCMMLIMNQAIELYTEVTEDAVTSSWWQEFEPANSFRKNEFFIKLTGNSEGEVEGEEWK